MDSAEKQHLHTSTELRGHYYLVRRWSGRLRDGLHVTCKSSLHPHQHRKWSLNLQQLKPCYPPGRGAQPSRHPLDQCWSPNTEHKVQPF